MKAIISTKEMRRLYKQAKKWDNRSAVIHLNTESGIGTAFGISKSWDSKVVDKTDVGTW